MPEDPFCVYVSLIIILGTNIFEKNEILSFDRKVMRGACINWNASRMYESNFYLVFLLKYYE